MDAQNLRAQCSDTKGAMPRTKAQSLANRDAQLITYKQSASICWAQCSSRGRNAPGCGRNARFHRLTLQCPVWFQGCWVHASDRFGIMSGNGANDVLRSRCAALQTDVLYLDHDLCITMYQGEGKYAQYACNAPHMFRVKVSF